MINEHLQIQSACKIRKDVSIVSPSMRYLLVPQIVMQYTKGATQSKTRMDGGMALLVVPAKTFTAILTNCNKHEDNN
eukprot:m.25488 g.25488  ORF g.25488 m.25488 type:complete len:77 (-) comp5770_c0_seq3:61-291(-)